MKKLAFAAALAAFSAMPALAQTSGAVAVKTMTGGANGDAKSSMTEAPILKVGRAPVELFDGNWAKVNANGSVELSKDGGKTWKTAPDGKLEPKTGGVIVVKNGMKQ